MIGKIIRRIAANAGYNLSLDYPVFLKKPNSKLSLNPECVLAYLACQRTKVSFIQIGANDGVSNDPIRDHVLRCGWKGLLIEPDPRMFAQLCKNYAGRKDLKILNRAVGTGEPMDFYFIKGGEGGVPSWATGLGSFSKEVLLSHAKAWPQIDKYLLVRKIDTITPTQMFSELGCAGVDLLVMDVEGYEWEILRNIDLIRHPIDCIYYESKHIPRKVHEKVLEYLVDYGYQVGVGGIDTVALKRY